MDWCITHVESIDSTMNWARERIKTGVPEGTVIIADSQSGGRGRRGNMWRSPVGNLYMTFIVMPDDEQLRALPFLCALAVHGALGNHDDITLKWPNDILYGGRKMGGILIEREGDAALCGVGVNIAVAPENASKAHDFDPSPTPQKLAKSILDKFSVLYKQPKDWREQWLRHCAFKNENVTFMREARAQRGILRGINQEGLVIIEDENGAINTYASGEVQEVRHAVGH